jgi:hypothetical protein
MPKGWAKRDRDNYGTLGNVNPHTGAVGTRPSRD